MVIARASPPTKQREAKQSIHWPSHDTHQSSAPNSFKLSSSLYSQSCSCLEPVHPVQYKGYSVQAKPTLTNRNSRISKNEGAEL